MQEEFREQLQDPVREEEEGEGRAVEVGGDE